MKETGEEVVQRVRQRLDHSLKIERIDDGLIFEHRNATYYVAEVDLKEARVTVPVAQDFQDHPDCDGEELVEHAVELLGPRLQMYRDRGYEVRETEWTPRQQTGSYDDRQIPVFVAYLGRKLDDWEEFYDELEWLVEQLPQK